MMRKETAVLMAVLAAVLFIARPVFAEGIKIAVIDVNKILNESNAGKAARKKMEARYAELKKKIEAVNLEARSMKEELDKQKILLGKEKVQEREAALAAKVGELRQLTQQSEKEMQARQEELTRDVLKVVEGQIDKVVGEDKIDLLIDKGSGVVRVAPSLEVTEKVLSRVNQEKAGGK
jgi:outer membrane protein